MSPRKRQREGGVSDAIVATLEFIIPGPPVPKARARVTKAGGSYTPARTRAYEQHAKRIALASCRGLPTWPLDGKYRVTIDVYRAARRGDLDNYAKAALDAFNGVLWADDRQVMALAVELHDGDPHPRMMARVEAVEPTRGAFMTLGPKGMGVDFAPPAKPRRSRKVTP